MAGGGLTIAQLAERTGVSQATLRAWEQRHSFPVPRRLASGHRRYADSDVELVRQVAREREGGLSMPAAVQRVLAAHERPAESIFAGVRRHTPGLEPRLIAKRSLIGIAHAFEDECLAQGERPLLVGSFQRERFYRQAQDRWRTLARAAEVAVVFADFDAVREPRDGPVELPLDRADPLAREWTLICCGGTFAAALSAWERPVEPGAERQFEVLWSIRREFVEEAARIAADLAARSSPPVAERMLAALARGPAESAGLDQLVALTNRMLAYVADGR